MESYFFRGVSICFVLRLHRREIGLRAWFQMPNLKQTNNKSRLTIADKTQTRERLLYLYNASSVPK